MVPFSDAILDAFGPNIGELLSTAYPYATSGDIPETIRNKLLILTDDEKEKLKTTLTQLETEKVFEKGFANGFYSKLFPS